MEQEFGGQAWFSQISIVAVLSWLVGSFLFEWRQRAAFFREARALGLEPSGEGRLLCAVGVHEGVEFSLRTQLVGDGKGAATRYVVTAVVADVNLLPGPAGDAYRVPRPPRPVIERSDAGSVDARKLRELVVAMCSEARRAAGGAQTE